IPKNIQGDDVVSQFTQWHGKEGIRSPRFEVRSDHRGIRRGVDDDEFRVRAGEPTATIGLLRLIACRIEYMSILVTQINDQLDGAFGQRAFEPMRAIQTLVKP